MIKHLFVPSSSDFILEDKSMVVLNGKKDGSDSASNAQPVEVCNEYITSMFEIGGLADNFDYLTKRSATSTKSTATDDVVTGCCSVAMINMKHQPTQQSSTQSTLSKSAKKKRRNKRNAATSGKSKESALPTITLGWSNTDANQYKNNRSTIVGTIKPYLRDGGLSSESKRFLLRAIECAIRAIPNGSMCFNVQDETDKHVYKHRMEMMKQFEVLLGGDGKSSDFRIEGVTIVIPLGIGPHRDSLNDSEKGMSSVVQINSRIPMTTKTIPGGQDSMLWKWLELNGYSTWFPCSLILYSRRCVYKYCVKEAEMVRFAEKDALRNCINFALKGRVGCDVDYLSTIWDNDKFLKRFQKQAIVKEASRFNGKMLSLTAAYDKTVSTE